MQLLLGFVLAMSVTIALIPPLMSWANRLQIVDMPDSRKVHAAPIPRVGGIAMAAGLLLSLALWSEFSAQMQAFYAGIVVLLIFGVLDDRFTLDAAPKFLGQAIAVLIVMYWGGVTISSITLMERIDLPHWLSAPLTFVFLIGVTNAINLADGLDGLAGGTSMLCLCALALLALTAGNAFVGMSAVVMIGAVLGFLRYNTHPARVFMGDAGSQILGFSVAVLSVTLTQDATTPLSTALPLLLLGVPIIDTLTVMTERIIAGHSPFKADRNHVHHRLLTLGFDHHEAVIMIYVVQTALFVTAWYMRYDSDLNILLVFLLFSAATIGSLRLGLAQHWRWRSVLPAANARHTSRLSLYLDWLRQPAHLPRWSGWVIGTGLAVFGLLAVTQGEVPSFDVQLLAVGVFVLVLLLLVLRWKRPEMTMVEKLALYICTTVAIYLDRHGNAYLAGPNGGEGVLFALMALAIGLRVYCSPARSFTVSSLDVLIIVIALAVPNLPNSIATQQALGWAVIRLVVLFYALETLEVNGRSQWRWLSLGICLFALGVAARTYLVTVS